MTDPSGNEADDSPRTITATTLETVLGAEVNADAISIYPNPVRTSLTIGWKEFRSAKIYSLSGKRILESSKNVIEITEIPSGTYILELRGLTDQLVRFKILKE